MNSHEARGHQRKVRGWLIPERSDAETGLRKALIEFMLRDYQLLKVGVNERSITHQIAVHLKKQFPVWHVDCEYNRDGHEPKRVHLTIGPTHSDDVSAQTVYPDIIIHRRGTDINLMAVEVKCGGADLEGERRDIKKLRAYKRELNYIYAVFVRLRTGPGRAKVLKLKWVNDA